jgi:hypothetical protein
MQTTVAANEGNMSSKTYLLLNQRGHRFKMRHAAEAGSGLDSRRLLLILM